MTKTHNILFLIGGALMVLGLGCFVLMLEQFYSSIAYLCGAIIFAVIQIANAQDPKYSESLTTRRLTSIQLLADLLFIAAGVLMLDSVLNFLQPLFTNYVYYVEYLYNKWLPVLLIAVVLEVYTVHRLDHELKKQKDK